MRLGLALILVLTVVVTDPGRADFAVCNKANVTVRVAIGQYNGTIWESRGWWTVPPRTCETLVSGRLNARFYYIYGSDGQSGSWGGNTYFCTLAQSQFRISGRGNCASRGYDRTGFFVVDTGNNRDWKLSLSN